MTRQDRERAGVAQTPAHSGEVPSMQDAAGSLPAQPRDAPDSLPAQPQGAAGPNPAQPQDTPGPHPAQPRDAPDSLPAQPQDTPDSHPTQPQPQDTAGCHSAQPQIRLLPEGEWRDQAAAHRARVDDLVGPYLERRAAGSKHPVIDFLFTYYGHKPAQLRRWHPGYGVALENAREYEGARGYRRHSVAAVHPSAGIPAGPWRGSTTPNSELADSGHDHAGVAEVRAGAADKTAPYVHAWAADPTYLARRRDTVAFVANLLRATASRPAQLSCFGLHEWAMVYRSEEVRHQQVPLRLGHEGTDAVVESMSLRCTHFDAFRFFTPDAVPRNAEPLTRESQLQREQPACLHANMDLYKWAFKLVPLVDSALLLDCFELACAARELDMRASPYDLAEYDYTPVLIETPAGRAEYVRNQADLAERAGILRTRLLTACQELLTHLPGDAVREPHRSPVSFEETRRVDSGGNR